MRIRKLRRAQGRNRGPRRRPENHSRVKSSAPTCDATPSAWAAPPKRSKRRSQNWRRASKVLVRRDRKSTRLNSSHGYISYAVFCLKKKKTTTTRHIPELARHKTRIAS